MIVEDTHVLAYLYLPGEYTVHAEHLLRRDPEWAAPSLWRSEFCGILAGYMRRGALSFTQACDLQAEAEGLLAGPEFEVDSQQVLELVRDSVLRGRLRVAALAMKPGTELMTMDAKLLRAFRKFAVALTAG